MAIELGIVTLIAQEIEEDKFAKELFMYENVKNLPQNLKSILVKVLSPIQGHRYIMWQVRKHKIRKVKHR